MIYDQNFVPQSDNEYQQRLLATTMLLVRAAGGAITIPRALLEDGLGGSMLSQTRSDNGDIVLVVTQHSTEVQ